MGTLLPRTDPLHRLETSRTLLHAFTVVAATAMWILVPGGAAPLFARLLPGESVRRLAILVLFAVLEIGTIMLLARVLRGESPAELLPSKRGWRTWLLRGIGIGIIANGLPPAVLTFLGRGRLAPALPMPPEAVLSVILAIPVGVIWEETVYRGVLLRWLRPAGAAAALGVSSLAFSALHFLAEPFALPRFLLLAALGLLFGIAYLVSSDLWFPIGAHLGVNIVGFVLANDPLTGGLWRFVIDARPEAWLALSIGGVAVAAGLAAALPRSLRRRLSFP